jgi:hypothetical protein
MIIGLHDSDKNKFPNYALMKISAYHKKRGDTVEWWNPLFGQCDVVYSSKVFDFTPENCYLPPSAIKGGTGYSVTAKLPPEIDAEYPDYSLYPDCDYAVGFTTRGCPRRCRWCVVPEKEGDIVPYRHWREIVRADSNKLFLWDNNILACEHGITQLAELAGTDYRLDVNQGMDARLVTPAVADVLARIKWRRYIRFSCDTDTQTEPLRQAMNLLISRGVTASRMFVYMLITEDIDSAVRRVEAVKKMNRSASIYAQAERNARRGIKPGAVQFEFAQRYIYSGAYRSKSWDEYRARFKGGTGGGYESNAVIAL